MSGSDYERAVAESLKTYEQEQRNSKVENDPRIKELRKLYSDDIKAMREQRQRARAELRRQIEELQKLFQNSIVEEETAIANASAIHEMMITDAKNELIRSEEVRMWKHEYDGQTHFVSNPHIAFQVEQIRADGNCFFGVLASYLNTHVYFPISVQNSFTNATISKNTWTCQELRDLVAPHTTNGSHVEAQTCITRFLTLVQCDLTIAIVDLEKPVTHCELFSKVERTIAHLKTIRCFSPVLIIGYHHNHFDRLTLL